nr:tautomerase family protein [uncultured Halomonas sp.]
MPQVKFYGLKAPLRRDREALSAAVQAALVTAFAVSEDKCFQRFIGLDAEDFIYPADRSERYTIIEISCFEGRSAEARRALIRLAYEEIGLRVGIGAQDVEITLFETPKANWGIGGKVAD